jgi:hypothetical protein
VRDHVGVWQRDDLTAVGDVAGEARRFERRDVGRQPATHLLRAQPRRQPIVLHDREPQRLALAQEQRARFGVGEQTRSGDDALQQPVEIDLAGERDRDVDERRDGLGSARPLEPGDAAVPGCPHVPWPQQDSCLTASPRFIDHFITDTGQGPLVSFWPFVPDFEGAW